MIIYHFKNQGLGRNPLGKSLEDKQRKGGDNMSKRYFYQDAITGKIVSENYAKKHPEKTIKHSFETKPKKGK